MGKFWQSVSQALEDLEKSYETWWNSMTEEERADYLIYEWDSTQKPGGGIF